jgi:hypothetical protein
MGTTRREQEMGLLRFLNGFGVSDPYQLVGRGFTFKMIRVDTEAIHLAVGGRIEGAYCYPKHQDGQSWELELALSCEVSGIHSNGLTRRIKLLSPERVTSEIRDSHLYDFLIKIHDP